MKNKIFSIQQEFISNKTLVNDFAKFNYRNLEDMLADLKPILAKYKCIISFNDDIVNVGNHNYVKSTATLTSVENNESISVTSFAREDEQKAGMSAGQMTGCSSSYSRKYALCGLFAVNEEKDLDALNSKTTKHTATQNTVATPQVTPQATQQTQNTSTPTATPEEVKKLTKQALLATFCKNKEAQGENKIELEKFFNYYNAKRFEGEMDVDKLWSMWKARSTARYAV